MEKGFAMGYEPCVRIGKALLLLEFVRKPADLGERLWSGDLRKPLLTQARCLRRLWAAILLLYLLPLPGQAATRVVAWGQNSYAYLVLPPGLTNVVAVAAGYGHNLALSANRTVIGWGENSYGQSTIPPGLTNVVAIAAGLWHSVALQADGRVTAWGDNRYGQATVPEGLSNVVGIGAGNEQTVALKADGTVVAWGHVYSEEGDVPVTIPDGVSNVVSIACGQSHTVGLKRDGTVIAWGYNHTHQTDVPPGLTNVVAVAAGGFHSLALKNNGSVVAWGADDGDQSSVPSNLLNVLAVAAGERHTLALQAEGTLAVWGANPYGGGVIPAGVSNVSAIACGTYHNLAVMQVAVIEDPPWVYRLSVEPPTGVVFNGGTVRLSVEAGGSEPLSYQWRFQGQEINGATDAQLVLIGLQGERSGYYSVVVSNRFGTAESQPLRVKASEIVTWGGNYHHERDVPFSAMNVVGVEGGLTHSAALLASGKPVVWGNRSDGISPGGSLQPPLQASNLVSIAAGAYFNVGLTADGRLVGWGDNSWGKLGWLGTLSNIVAVAAGYDHTLALRADGTVFATGLNQHGELNLAKGVDDIVAVSAGNEITVALRSDGTVLAGGQAVLSIPVDATNVVAIDAGASHALALRADGRVVEWGIKRTDIELVPMPSDLTNVVAIAAGSDHDLALLADGRVIGWGAKWAGQISVPTWLSNVTAISAGFSHSLALVKEGVPRLVQSPSSFTGSFGGNARLAAKAIGALPLHYQWRQDGLPLLGATRAMLALDNISPFDNGQYDVVVSNSYGSVTSQVATLSVVWTAPGSISVWVEPTNQTAFLHGKVRFTAYVPASPPLAYRWLFEGQPVLNARDSVLELQDVGYANAGLYSVIALNPLGAVTSAPVRLTVAQVAAWGGHNVGSDERVFKVPAGLSNVIALSASAWHVLALRQDGSVVGWGDGTGGKLQVPPSATNLVAVAAGGEFSLGLRADGSVLVWGGRSYGVNPPPPGLTNVVQIAAAYSWALALKADGTVAQWGTYIGGYMKPPPLGLSNVVQIAAGTRHALALLRDGRVVAWGEGDWGEVTPPPELGNVVSILAGDSCLALRDDGTAVEWWPGHLPSPIGDHLVAIGMGYFHRVGLREDGTVVSWGWENGGEGQTRVPPDLPGVIGIAAAGDASFAIIPSSPAPHIARHPRGQTILSGNPLRLEAAPFPGPGLTLQWLKNGTPVTGFTGRVLYIDQAQPIDSGAYTLAVANAFGSVTSRVANVIVQGPIDGRLVASWPGFLRGDAQRVLLQGRHAFVTGDMGFTILDLSDPFKPIEVGTYDLWGSAVGLLEEAALVGTSRRAGDLWIPYLAVLDLRNLNRPVLSGGCDVRGEVRAIVVVGNLLYLAETHGLEVIDASNLNQLKPVAYLELPGEAYDLVLQGQNAFVASSAGLWVADVSRPATPSWLANLVPGYHVYSLALSGASAFLACGEAGLHLVEFPTWTNALVRNVPGVAGSVRKVVLQEHYVWASTDADGLQVVDVSDPFVPMRVGNLSSISGVGEFILDGPYAYVALQDWGLGVFQIAGNAPRIIREGEDQTVVVGQTAALSVLGAGSPPLSFQWARGAVALSDDARVRGSAHPELTLSDVRVSDAGAYRVQISNPQGTVISREIQLKIVSPPLEVAHLEVGRLQLSFSTAPGHRYTMETKPHLGDGEWTSVRTWEGTGTRVNLEREIDADQQSFFRLKAE
jgi:alpha-tubulin suppressor-like RCC1 family protein